MATESKELKLPQALVDLWSDVEIAQKQITKEVVLNMVEKMKISKAKAAEILEMSLQDFIELMAEEKMPYYRYTPNTIEKGLGNLQKSLEKDKR